MRTLGLLAIALSNLARARFLRVRLGAILTPVMLFAIVNDADCMFNPIDIGGDTRIDTILARTGTSMTPRNQTL